MTADFELPNGDANGDNLVNLLDLSSVLAMFGTSDPSADLDGSGRVGIGDLSLVLANFGSAGDS